jgi:uncharacterized membrane protein
VWTMHDWMMNGWGSMGGFGFILWLLILGAIIAGVVCSFAAASGWQAALHWS